jgi:CO/xanthine dehydrogenase Mo-binding subunit
MTRPLPASLAANPRLSTWVSFDEPGRITVSVGKVEIGQGILTAFAQIAAEELEVALDRITVRQASTAHGPVDASTVGSLSVSETGTALRQVCAEARAVLLDAVAGKLGCPAGGLTVRGGEICDMVTGAMLSYWDVAEPGLLDRDADGIAVPRSPGAKDTSPARLDLPDKVLGRPRFIHDLELPGQLFGRVVRPPSRAASLVSVDEGVAAGAVTVVRDGDFLGVIAEREEVAVRDAEALAKAAHWHEHDSLPDQADLVRWLHEAPSERIEVVDTSVSASADDVVDVVRASYSRPFLAHASIAPSCGVAQWNSDGTLTIWSHTQGVFALRDAVAQAVGLAEAAVVVHHVEGAGCYGHNGADDAAYDAVLLARAVPGRPVQVVWSRADELGWEPLGSAMVIDLAAGVDADGRVVTWEQDVWSQGHVARPGFGGTVGLLAASHVAGGTPLAPSIDAPLARGGGSLRNADPAYDFPARRVTGHLLRETPLRSSSLRSLGAHANVFAIESFVDELALHARADPVDYRVGYLFDERAVRVVEHAAAAADWAAWEPADPRGHGIGFARYKGTGGYCAVVAEVEAAHEVRVTRLVVAADVGRVVSLDGVVNQLEGGAVQAASWTLLEQVRFDRRAVTSTDWESYPILRFNAAPQVEVEVISRPDQPSLGAGEITQGPTAAAIANAVRDALGISVRDLPLTPERIVAALEAQP